MLRCYRPLLYGISRGLHRCRRHHEVPCRQHVLRSCFAALRPISSVRRSLPQHALLRQVRALVITKLDQRSFGLIWINETYVILDTELVCSTHHIKYFPWKSHLVVHIDLFSIYYFEQYTCSLSFAPAQKRESSIFNLLRITFHKRRRPQSAPRSQKQLVVSGAASWNMASRLGNRLHHAVLWAFIRTLGWDGMSCAGNSMSERLHWNTLSYYYYYYYY